MVQADTIEQPETIPVGDIDINLLKELVEATGPSAKVDTNGNIYVWHMETGERRAVNKSLLGSQMQKKLVNGMPAFSMEDPEIPAPAPPVYPCMLHPDHTSREAADSYGLPVCYTKMRSPLEVNRHMQYTHNSEHEALKEHDARLRESADRVERQEQMSLQATLLNRLVSGQTAPVSEPETVSLPSVRSDRMEPPPPNVPTVNIPTAWIDTGESESSSVTVSTDGDAQRVTDTVKMVTRRCSVCKEAFEAERVGDALRMVKDHRKESGCGL